MVSTQVMPQAHHRSLYHNLSAAFKSTLNCINILLNDDTILLVKFSVPVSALKGSPVTRHNHVDLKAVDTYILLPTTTH